MISLGSGFRWWSLIVSLSFSLEWLIKDLIFSRKSQFRNKIFRSLLKYLRTILRLNNLILIIFWWIMFGWVVFRWIIFRRIKFRRIKFRQILYLFVIFNRFIQILLYLNFICFYCVRFQIYSIKWCCFFQDSWFKVYFTLYKSCLIILSVLRIFVL